MRRRQRFLTVFIIFFVLSLLAFALFSTTIGKSMEGFVEIVTSPLQKIARTSVVSVSSVDTNKTIRSMQDENKKLIAALVNQKETEKENQALKDQFATTTIEAKKLLPATIIGSRTANAAISEPTEIVLDKGKGQGVSEGEAVVYKDMVIGQIVTVSQNRSVVRLPISNDANIPAKTTETNALGILKGQGDSMLFDNVLLSDSLKVKDIVVTKGDMNERGKGYPPGLIIGKVVAVHKKASALFQTAEIEPVLSINKLTTVFIYLPK